MSVGVKALAKEIREDQIQMGRSNEEATEFLATYLTTFCEAYYQVNTQFASVVDNRLRTIKKLRERRKSDA